MLTKIKNILLWPFKVDDASFSEKGVKTCFISIIFLAAVLFSLYKAGKYYYDIYYLPIDAQMAVQDYFIQDEARVLKEFYNEKFPFISAAVNLHFNSIKEKPQIVTIVEPYLPENETVVERANKLFNEIGIGSAEYNNGVLIYVTDINNLSFKIEVGYGLEDVITDSKAGMILDNAFNKAGGKENLNVEHLNKVLVYIFTDIANIIAEKYNVDISEDLEQDGFADIKYYEPLDDLGLFLKYYMIAAFCIIILLIFSKRYFAMIIFFPTLIAMLIALFINIGAVSIIACIFLPIIFSIYFTDEDKKKDKKKDDTKKEDNNPNDEYVFEYSDNAVTDENMTEYSDTKESREITNQIMELNTPKTYIETRKPEKRKRNLLSLTFIPAKNKFNFSNMPYQFVLFYSAFFFIIYFGILYVIGTIDYKAIDREIINPREVPVEKKLSMYTNVDGFAGYYKEGSNTYILDDSLSKELYGINYLFQQSEYKPKIAAYFIKEKTLQQNTPIEKIYSYYKLDKLENKNGLLIVFYFNPDDNKSRMEMIAGDGLKSVLSEYDMEGIKRIALEHAYHGETMYMDSDFTLKEPEDYTKKQFLNSIKKANKTLGIESDVDAEKQAAMLSNVLDFVNKNDDFSRMNMILTYKENGNCVKVLQEAVEQSAAIIAKAYNINLNDEKLLTYYSMATFLEVSRNSIYSIIKFIIVIFVLLAVITITIFIRSMRKVALYGLALAVALFIVSDINVSISDILIKIILALFFIIGILLIIFGKGGSSGGGRFRSGRSRSSGSSFGGFSRSRSSRSFGGGGRSGGGGAFRR